MKSNKRLMPNVSKRRMPKDNEGKRVKGILLIILNKVSEHDRVLEVIKKNIEVMKHMISSYSRLIQLLKNLTGHVMPHLHPPQSRGLPSEVLSNPKIVVWTLTLTEDPVKLNEVSDHSARHRVDRGAILMSLNRCELDVHVLILFSGVAGLTLRSRVEIRHVESFGELAEPLKGSPNIPTFPSILGCMCCWLL
ncbi:hypothetical protein H5410_045517 [Solanum commersonii]|uniref:Uncharacterized protein n=1 Tax=Solanum commersonii TaxID=4109 RepID=A0A9J5X9T8_SOLCO|nr:hypothetical protein H5410_045517 [Solanum commersonii]